MSPGQHRRRIRAYREDGEDYEPTDRWHCRWVPDSLGCVGTVIASSCIPVPKPVVRSIAAAAHVWSTALDGLGRSNCPHPHNLASCLRPRARPRPRSGRYPRSHAPTAHGFGRFHRERKRKRESWRGGCRRRQASTINLAKMEFLRVWRKGRIEGPPLCRPLTPHPSGFSIKIDSEIPNC